LRQITPNFLGLEELLRQWLTPMILGKMVGEDDVVEDNDVNESRSVKPNDG